MSDGVITPRKKNLLRLLCLALLARRANGTVCSHIKKERRKHRLLLRQIGMNADVQWESTDSRSQLRFKQKEGRVWQALLLISPAFVETLRETLFPSQDHSSDKFDSVVANSQTDVKSFFHAGKGKET